MFRKLVLYFFSALLLISAREASPSEARGMKEVPFEVINKSGQAVTVQLWRYEDDYPAKFYAFSLEKGTRARPRSGVWEVWRGDYVLIVFGDNMQECLLPMDDLDYEPGVEITIKGRYRLVVPPCQEIFSNPGEPSQSKYNWTESYVADPTGGPALPAWWSHLQVVK